MAYQFVLYSIKGYINGVSLSQYQDGHDLIYGSIAYAKPLYASDLPKYQKRIDTNNCTKSAYDVSTPENRPCNPVLFPPYDEQPMGEGGEHDINSDYYMLLQDTDITEAIIRKIT